MPKNNAAPDPSLYQVTSADGTEISFERSGQGQTLST